MATINGLDLGLSGSTGTVHFVGSTSPTLVTPILGAATATSLAFSPTTSGIIGTATNDNAAAGKVGEVISSYIVSGSALSLTTTTVTNLTSISLTTGDWDVYGSAAIIGSTANLTDAIIGVNTTSATLPDASLYSILASTTPCNGFGTSAPFQRLSLSITTTVYLVVYAVFGSGTATACGGIIARRAR